LPQETQPKKVPPGNDLTVPGTGVHLYSPSLQINFD
jgi:hypothetical protein